MLQIDAQDIANAVQIIDMVSSRGAIRGEEMVAVGTLRTKFVSYLEQLQKQAQEAQVSEDE